MEQEKQSTGGKSPPENKGAPKKPKKKRSAGSYAIEFFIKVGVTALAIWALLTFVVSININHSNSGYPMIKDGDLCISYRRGKIVNNDVYSYKQGGKVKFGRIMAEAGDSVSFMEESLMVNGYGVYEDTVYPTTEEGVKIPLPYTVPQGSVFLLNDYRNDLDDSRTFGGVPQEDIIGKVILIIRRRGI
ncbi:MAG: signal peptidase I [Eubacterium sp.]|nr:signal peptidase I [Eubacterium sp.]